MFDLPQKGQRIRGEFAGRVVDEVNRNHIIAGRGIALRRTPSGTVIDCTAESVGKAVASGLKPWAVRYHKPAAAAGESEPDGQWEVYLPPGTLTIRSNCYVMNDPASNTTGHDDEANWYKIPVYEGGSWTGSRTFLIVAHGKPNVMMYSGNNEYTVASPFVSVDAIRESVEDPMSDEDYSSEYAGDVWNTVIATVTITKTTTNNVTTFKRSVLQVAKAAVNVQADTPTYFRPVWMMTWGGSSASAPLSVDEIHLEDRTVYVGGVATVAPDVNLSASNAGYCRIYLTIDTSGATPTAALSRVYENPSDAPLPSTASSLPIILFEMYNMRVTSDLRRNLQNLPYYRGIA